MNMKIDAFNVEIINNNLICIHDYTFDFFQFNYEANCITIALTPPGERIQQQKIICYGVLGFEMTSCDFWGISPHIYSWTCTQNDNQQLLKRFIDEKKKYNYHSSKLDENKKYVEIVFTFVSGDRLSIVCDNIQYIG